MNPRLEAIEKDSVLNEIEKSYYINTMKLVMCFNFLENNFGDEITRLHNIIKAEGDTTTFTITKETERSYLSFLKYLNLNNPQYLYNLNYSRFCQSILSNNTLNIALIGETPIDEWLRGVKSIMSDLLGFEEGLFYNVLIANAYSKQFIDKEKELSKKQIINIGNYYKGEDLEKILLFENEEIIKQKNF